MASNRPDSKDLYCRFRMALRAREFGAALEAARQLPGMLSLLDGLELTLLAAEARADQLYEELAARWVARITVEKRLPLGRQARAVAVFQAAGEGAAEDAFASLSEYV